MFLKYDNMTFEEGFGPTNNWAFAHFSWQSSMALFECSRILGLYISGSEWELRSHRVTLAAVHFDRFGDSSPSCSFHCCLSQIYRPCIMVVRWVFDLSLSLSLVALSVTVDDGKIIFISFDLLVWWCPWSAEYAAV